MGAKTNSSDIGREVHQALPLRKPRCHGENEEAPRREARVGSPKRTIKTSCAPVERSTSALGQSPLSRQAPCSNLHFSRAFWPAWRVRHQGCGLTRSALQLPPFPNAPNRQPLPSPASFSSPMRTSFTFATNGKRSSIRGGVFVHVKKCRFQKTDPLGSASLNSLRRHPRRVIKEWPQETAAAAGRPWTDCQMPF